VTLYLKDNGIPAALPEHDVAIIAMGNAERASAALRSMERRLAHWPKPILNLPANILGLERDRLCALLRSVPVWNALRPCASRGRSWLPSPPAMRS